MRCVRVAFTLVVLLCPRPAAADWDLTLFLGRAYPVSDDRLTLRAPSVPSLPGVEVMPSGTPEISAGGGPVFGGALAWEAGVFGIEGRLDATEVGLDFTGARYDLRATAPPLAGLSGAVRLHDGRFDADRLMLLSLNLRLRTPGSSGVFVSGGLSYLPDVTLSGSVPLAIEVEGVPVLPGIQPNLQLLVGPDESGDRFGFNGGAGLRLGGGRLALVAEARVFYFDDYRLEFGVRNAPPFVDELLSELDPVRFEPVIVNAVAGLVLRF